MSPCLHSKAGGNEKDNVGYSAQAVRTGESCCSHSELKNEESMDQSIAKSTGTSSTNRFHGSGFEHRLQKFCMPDVSGVRDVEKGLNSFEHVILKFEGSNCPGCTSTITSHLSSIPAVLNVQMNTILLQADFDVDLAESSICDVVETIQRIGHGLQELNVIMSGIHGQLSDLILPLGVKELVWMGKNNYNVKYDARVIGIRKLIRILSKTLDTSISLLPSDLHEKLPTNIRMTAYRTIFSSLLTVPILILAWAPLPEHQLAYMAVSLALATIIQVFIAGPFYLKALRSLVLTRRMDMDLLIVLSVSMAYGLSIASFVGQLSGSMLASRACFETSALLITFIMMGRLVSDFACHRSIQWRSVRSLQSQNVLLIDNSESDIYGESEMDVRLLQYGDIFKVKPGCSVVTDGTIISGTSEFDESIMTGEAALVARAAGSSVTAGSINQDGTVLVQLTRLSGENTIDQIAGMVEEVTRSKMKTQQIADRVAKWIAPVVGMLAVLTFVIWFAVGVLVLDQSISLAIRNAMTYAISVLVVTCPCAIGLAVPMVLIVVSRIGTKAGIIFRSAEAMEVAKDVTHVVFDKTGTLTESQMTVVSEKHSCWPPNLTATIVLALTRQSKHPVSCAVSKHLENAGVEPAPVTNVTTVVGKGLEGTWNGQVVRIGNARWLGVETSTHVQAFLARDHTVLCVAQGEQLLATYGLDAVLRGDACSVVASLMERGISVSMLSGDELGSVHKVATELKIPHNHVQARCTPLEKQQRVKNLMDVNKDTILFCGDGVNDAAALAQASLGLLMCSDTSLMQNKSDAVLTSPNLSSLLTLIELSQHSYRQVVFNFTWAIVYNVVAILLAAGAFVKIRLPPEYAGLGEAVSILPIIFGPLHLQTRKYAQAVAK